MKTLQSFFENTKILVTGGTGTIGSEIVKQLLKYNPKVIRILTNSENELWETKLEFKEYQSKLRFLLGDIRNFDRVKRAMEGIDYVFNAAAIKHVPICEYNPMEAVNVNIGGLNNIIEAAIIQKVKKIIHISTDKAVEPTTAMGATKMLGERLCITRNLSKGKNPLIISCVRFGNVLGSRGSIIPLVKKQIQDEQEITLTAEKMNRFFMSIEQAGDLVLKSMKISKGAEIFVLKMDTIRIKDLIEVIIEEYAPKIGKDPSNIKIKIIGARIGEKYDEELISKIEYISCYETDEMYIIYPSMNYGGIIEFKPEENERRIKMDQDFKYNTKYQEKLTKEEIKNLIVKKLKLI